VEAEKGDMLSRMRLSIAEFADVYLWPLIAIAVPPLIAAPTIHQWLTR